LNENQRLRPEKSEVYRLYGSNKKITENTDWVPKFDLKSGLSETINWFRKPENIVQYKSDIYNI
jgi:nucleoside-diphosphate-sugar epimerase